MKMRDPLFLTSTTLGYLKLGGQGCYLGNSYTSVEIPNPLSSSRLGCDTRIIVIFTKSISISARLLCSTAFLILESLAQNRCDYTSLHEPQVPVSLAT